MNHKKYEAENAHLLIHVSHNMAECVIKDHSVPRRKDVARVLLLPKSCIHKVQKNDLSLQNNMLHS